MSIQLSVECFNIETIIPNLQGSTFEAKYGLEINQYNNNILRVQ